MSRIGKLPISIPAGVTVNYDANTNVVNVKGPKGELSQWIDPSIKFLNADGQISFEIDENSPVNVKQKQAFHGLYRSLVNNMVVGVSEGYTKVLELVVLVIVFLIRATLSSLHWVTHTLFSFSCLRRLRLRLSLKETRTQS